MDRKRLLEARRRLGILPSPAPVLVEPEGPKTANSTTEQPVEVQANPAERPLEPFDLIAESTLRMVRSAQPVRAQAAAPEPQFKPAKAPSTPLVGLLTGAAGLGLVAAGVAMGASAESRRAR